VKKQTPQQSPVDQENRRQWKEREARQRHNREPAHNEVEQENEEENIGDVAHSLLGKGRAGVYEWRRRIQQVRDQNTRKNTTEEGQVQKSQELDPSRKHAKARREQQVTVTPQPQSNLHVHI